MATNFGIGSNRTIFADGEGITSCDLTDISKNAIRRAWEVPGVADLVAFDLLDATYNGAMASATALKGRNTGVFTVGGGLCPHAFTGMGNGGKTGIDRGVIGIWTESTVVTLPGASGDGKMLWGLVDTATAGLVVTSDNPATDLYRWDLISVSASEIDIATVTRDYKDATTGAETSEDVVPAKVVQFAYTVTKGTEGAVDAVTVPALPAGERYLYAVKLAHASTAANVVELRDYTIPLGKLIYAPQTASMAMTNHLGDGFDLAWVSNGETLIALDATTKSTAYLCPPAHLMGPSVRILGFTLAHEINNSSGGGDAALIKLVRRTVSGEGVAEEDIVDLSSRFTSDGTATRTFIDLRGLPADGVIPQPLWGNGKTTKESFVHHYDAATIPCLQITSPSRSGSKCKIYGITWFAVGV